MSTKKKNELVVKNDFEVSNEFTGMFDQSLGMGASENIDAEDIVIPKVHLAQALTPEVSSGVVKAGAYMNSVEKTAIGDALDMFVIGKVKLWQFYYEVKQGKKSTKEYLGTIEHTPFNKDLAERAYIPEELQKRAEEKGVNEDMLLKPDKVLRFSVLLLEEILGGFAFPYFVDFKRTSYPAGKQLESIFAKMKSVKLPSYAKVFNLTSEFVSNDYDYYVKKVSLGRNISKEELPAVEAWLKELAKNKGKYRADESDIEEENNTFEAEASEVNTNQKF
jgi:hypothetical protein